MTHNTTRERDNFDLNCSYRHGGNLIEDREYGRDCVTQMLVLRRRPDILANALRDMGITENGDGMPDAE
jgi:hypothetical protein